MHRTHVPRAPPAQATALALAAGSAMDDPERQPARICRLRPCATDSPGILWQPAATARRRRALERAPPEATAHHRRSSLGLRRPSHHGHAHNHQIWRAACRIRRFSGPNAAELCSRRRATSEGPDGRARLDPPKEGEEPRRRPPRRPHGLPAACSGGGVARGRYGEGQR